MSSLGCLNFVLVNFTVASILQYLLIVRLTSRPFFRIRTAQLDLVCTKLSTKLVAGIVINITLVRPCSVFPKFRFFFKFSLLLWQFKTTECQALVTNTGRINVASIMSKFTSLHKIGIKLHKINRIHIYPNIFCGILIVCCLK